jgi:hypothetical protein
MLQQPPVDRGGRRRWSGPRLMTCGGPHAPPGR